jgi:type VI secretion system protein ImpH
VSGSPSDPGPRFGAVIQTLAAAPYRWDFYAAMRALDANMPAMPRLGTARRPGDEPVRLSQAADLSFAASSLCHVDLSHRLGKPRVQVRFFGLFGPQGPLPLHLTAYARERRLHKGDETLQVFADLFHHRLLLLFYRAWAQAQPVVGLDRPAEDRWADLVGALAGIGGPEWRGRDAAPHAAKLRHAGTLARQARSADGLQGLLSDQLRVHFQVEPFVGRWMPLAMAERSRLGRGGRPSSSAQLGASAVLGAAVFDRQHHIRLHAGPLDRATFESLLPGGRALPALRDLVRQFIGDELGWDLRLELRADARQRLRLGQQARLGWTTWLGAPRGGRLPALKLNPGAPCAVH